MTTTINAQDLAEAAEIMDKAGERLWSTDRALAERLINASGAITFHVKQVLKQASVSVTPAATLPRIPSEAC